MSSSFYSVWVTDCLWLGRAKPFSDGWCPTSHKKEKASREAIQNNDGLKLVGCLLMLWKTNTQRTRPSCFKCARRAASISRKDMLHTERLWFVWLDLEFCVDTYSASSCQEEKSISLGSQSVWQQSSFRPAALPLCERGSLWLIAAAAVVVLCRFVPFKVVEEKHEAMKSKWQDSGVPLWPIGFETYLMAATSPAWLLLLEALVEYSFSFCPTMFPVCILNCHQKKKAKTTEI